MRTFLAIVDAGGFTAAAPHGDVPANVSSKRVRQLEQHLGVQLLQRTTRSVRPTEAGRDYATRCRELLALLDETEASVRSAGEDLQGTLRVAMPPGFV
ncbi:MAG: LysR family transcriptional regulator, partial [Myxococcota bacterium]